MPVFVEAIGGTGKAVVNLLKFTEEIAGIVGEQRPDYTCAVIDQDAESQSVWPGVPIQQPASGMGGPFAAALGITQPAQHCAAHLLFSAEELALDVGRGFHGHAKLVVSLAPEGTAPRDASQDPTHVLVYSDFGGTGAGLGPLRLQQLLMDPVKTYVIAIVFGKYLNRGAQTPIGYPWLQHQGLTNQQAHRWFFGFYVQVPWLHVDTSAPPASGLNAAPALLLATAYIWRLAEASRDTRLEQFLQTNAIRTDRRQVKVVSTYHDGDFSIEGSETRQDFMTRLRQCAQTNRLNGLIRKKMSLNVALREALQRGLAPACWQVFRAQQPAGQTPALSVNWAHGFTRTFESVPDPWAAAEWFHRAVAAGDPTCRDAFLRLIGLFVQGKLHVFRTTWGPPGGPEVYALSTQALTGPNNRFTGTEQFMESVVGGFSCGFPFWTVSAFVEHLRAEEVRGEPSAVTLRLRAQSTCGRVYQTQSQPIQAPDAPYSVHIQPVQNWDPSSWSWAIYLRAEGWDSLGEQVSGWDLLRNNVEVYQSVLTVPSPDPATTPPYTCAIRGINLKRRLLEEEDGIFVGQHKGFQYYEVQVDPESGIKRVLNNAEDDPQPRFVQAGHPLVVQYGNIRIEV